MKIEYLKRGFTLTELLMYISVLTIIVLAISAFLLWTIRSNNKAKAMRETLDNARRVMEIIAYEIKEANDIYTPTTTTTQLSLETTHYLPEEEDKTYIEFFLCGTKLCLKKESQDPITITSEKVEVQTISFTRVATDVDYPSVQINLKMDYKNPSKIQGFQASVSLTSTISLRSY